MLLSQKPMALSVMELTGRVVLCMHEQAHRCTRRPLIPQLSLRQRCFQLVGTEKQNRLPDLSSRGHTGLGRAAASWSMECLQRR